jgi:hypothetical protein
VFSSCGIEWIFANASMDCSVNPIGWGQDHRQLRFLVGDGLGLYLVSRRFEGGRLRQLLAFAAEPGARQITTAELALLLEGATFTVHRRAKPWR